MRIGESVLITGGSGSFGTAFVRHLLQNKLSERICIYSRGEHRQAQMRAEFKDDQRLRFFVGDIRDQDRLRRAMDGADVVVHAAALKRIETCFYNPGEMVKTNVLGTLNVVEAATDAGVKKVVGLSTDKAFQPVSAYGQSKALAESIVLAANNSRSAKGPLFAATRYGNVWGSAGSIVPKWRELIGIGQTTVPVTDPEATRFFMTIQEAVELVLTTIETMDGGELVIPELPAYRVGDLATAMDVGMEIIGLPAFEKLNEGMKDGLSSDQARRMTVGELREALTHV